MLLYSEVLSCAQCHIWNQQTLYWWVLGGVNERHDTVQYTRVREHVLEVQIVVVGQSHTAQDNLICLSAERYVSHHLVVWLVWVSKEWNLLSRHQGIVQVDTCDTSSDELRWLFTANWVHTWTTNLHLLTLNSWSAIDWITIGVEEATSQLLAHLQRWSFAEEHYFCIGWDTLCTLKHLQCHIVAHNLNDLCQLTIHGSELVVTYSFGFQRASCFGDSRDLSINLLKCFCHSRYAFI